MSQYLVELYTPRPSWLALSTDQRQQFLSAIGQAMGGLTAHGVEILSLAPVEAGIEHASEHQFVGIWRFADAQGRTALLQGIQASGWYDFFDHRNAACSEVDFASHAQALINA